MDNFRYCTECKEHKLVRDCQPQEDGTYICMGCLNDPENEHCYWD